VISAWFAWGKRWQGSMVLYCVLSLTGFRLIVGKAA